MKKLRVTLGVIFFLGFLSICHAKCSYMPQIIAEIEFDQCQGVRFEASTSKVDWFHPDEPPFYIQEQGEAIVGTLIVGKVKSSEFQKKESRYKLPSVWNKGAVKAMFLKRNPKEICPEILPGIYKVTPSGSCCDVLPYRGECLVPKTISVVQILENR